MDQKKALDFINRLLNEEKEENDEFTFLSSFLSILSGAVNNEAVLSTEQQMFLGRCILDILKGNTSDMNSLSILPIATYINSCK